MSDIFQNHNKSTQAPATNAYSINLGAAGSQAYLELDQPTRAIWVGIGGDLVVRLVGDTEFVTLTNVNGGSLLPLRIAAIDVNTDAEEMVALY